jgi:hypothetical protein
MTTRTRTQIYHRRTGRFGKATLPTHVSPPPPPTHTHTHTRANTEGYPILWLFSLLVLKASSLCMRLATAQHHGSMASAGFTLTAQQIPAQQDQLLRLAAYAPSNGAAGAPFQGMLDRIDPGIEQQSDAVPPPPFFPPGPVLSGAQGAQAQPQPGFDAVGGGGGKGGGRGGSKARADTKHFISTLKVDLFTAAQMKGASSSVSASRPGCVNKSPYLLPGLQCMSTDPQIPPPPFR